MISSSFISTASLSEETRSSIIRLQAKLVEAQKELETGRLADVGATLGGNTGTVVSLRQQTTQLQSIIDANKIVDTRLKSTQSTLDSITTNAQNFLSSLISAQSSSAAAQTIVQDSKSGLQSLIEGLNNSIDGQYLFAGINSDVKPLDDHFATPTSTSKQAIDSAFFAKFGISQTDPAVSQISASDLSDFLDNQYAAIFSDPNWGNSWSAASDKNVRNRISKTELLETSTNANHQSFRDLTAALAMVSDLGFDNLNETARQTLLTKAQTLAGKALTGIATVQSELGLTQSRVTSSNEQLDLQKTLLTNTISGFESVDTAEVSTRVSALVTQVETAYALTKRLHDLSLLNYLR